jgi:hypothetical protein
VVDQQMMLENVQVKIQIFIKIRIQLKDSCWNKYQNAICLPKDNRDGSYNSFDFAKKKNEKIEIYV